MHSELLSIFTGIAALLLVLGLIWLAQRLLHRTGWAPRANNARRLRLQEAIALDARRRLHLVRCDGREILLLTGGGQDVVIGWLSAEAAKP